MVRNIFVEATKKCAKHEDLLVYWGGMNKISRWISTLTLTLGGLFVILVTLNEEPDTWSRLWGMSIIGVGVYIFFNKKEDDIEEIKSNDTEK